MMVRTSTQRLVMNQNTSNASKHQCAAANSECHTAYLRVYCLVAKQFQTHN